MVSHHPSKFGDHRHCGSGDMFLVAEEENSRYSCFNPPLLFNRVRQIACTVTSMHAACTQRSFHMHEFTCMQINQNTFKWYSVLF